MRMVALSVIVATLTLLLMGDSPSKPDQNALVAALRRNETPTGSPTMQPRLQGVRTLKTAVWDTIWYRGGSEGDTVLVQPYMIAADDRRLYVLDIARKRVAAFRAADGTLDWITPNNGRGGPLFQTPVAIGMARQGFPFVIDRDRAQFVLLDSLGRVVDTVSLAQSPNMTYACPLSGTGYLLATIPPPSPLVRIDLQGRRVRDFQLPWADLRTLSSLAAQSVLANSADGSSCVFALALGRGFASVDSLGFQDPHPFIERFDPPEVTATGSTPQGLPREEHLKERRIAVISMVVWEDSIGILFEGLTSAKKRLIDLYRRHDGVYLGSFRLPNRAIGMAHEHGQFFILESRGGLYNVLALRPRLARSAH